MPGRGLLKTPPARGYYPADVVVLGYLAVVSALLLASPRGIPGQAALAAVHLGLLVAVALLRFAPRERRGAVGVVRHLYPLALLPLAYGDLAHLTRLLTGGYYDALIVRADQALFGCQISQTLHTLVPFGLLSEFTHLSYLLYEGLIPLVALPLCFAGRRAELRLVTTTLVTTFAACYLTFIVFPVRGPFHYFGPIDPGVLKSFFATLSHQLLEHGSAQGTAFPSSHVAVAVVVWMMCRRVLPRLAPLLLVIVFGIVVGTVYGGFHYGTDAIAGLGVGIVFGWLGPRLHAVLLTALGMAPTDVPVQEVPRLPRRRSERERLAPVDQPAPRESPRRRGRRQTELVPAHADEDGVPVQVGSTESEPRVKSGETGR